MIVPPSAVVPGVDVPGASFGTAVLPQFAAFVVTPQLLQAPVPLLVVAPATEAPMEIVVVQAPAAAAPVQIVAPAAAPAPVPMATPQAAPARAAARPAKPYRN